MSIKSCFPWVILVSFFLTSCDANNSSSQKEGNMAQFSEGSFGFDLQFLQQHDSELVVLESGNSKIIVSPKYQGKVFTSTANGDSGMSYGWVNYKAFTGQPDPHMNAYGGADRFWLGPEGGKFSLYFKQGDSMVFNNWKTPAAIDTEPWEKSSANHFSVSMVKDADLTNYAGTRLQMKLGRTVEIVDKKAMAAELNTLIPDEVSSVGFITVNSIENTGPNEWTKETGAPCIWNLDMLMPSEKCIIVIPYEEGGSGKIATTDYFGEVAADRIKMQNGTIFFKADGKSRGKIGVGPARVKNIAGSYDPVNQLLTIAQFDITPGSRYLNQEWTTSKDAYSGDAMNAYNDGPLDDGSQMGPFYEIESVSPPAFLKPGEKLTHRHSLFQFTGSRQQLNDLAISLLGVSLDEIEKSL